MLSLNVKAAQIRVSQLFAMWKPFPTLYNYCKWIDFLSFLNLLDFFLLMCNLSKFFNLEIKVTLNKDLPEIKLFKIKNNIFFQSE